MLLLQISDPHIRRRGETLEGRVDTASGLRAAIALASNAPARPDLVILSGDLVNDGTEEEYEHLVELLDSLSVPYMAIMGNHDSRGHLRRFLPKAIGDATVRDDAAINWVMDIDDGWPRRIIGLDTTEPGRHGGVLDQSRIEWLDERLTESSDRPVLVVQHHPPFVSGIDFMDQYGLDGAGAEAAVLARHEHVVGVICGHLHRPVMTSVGGVTVISAPSSAAQVALDLSGGTTAYTDEPGMVAWHHWTPGGLVSHITPVGPITTWQPSWAMVSGG